MTDLNVDDIRRNYDLIAESYVEQRNTFKSLPHLARLARLLPAGGTVLDIGCGGGVPVAAYLRGHGFKVQGIDLSERMIDLARQNVPGGTFAVRDMLDLTDGEFEVDGVVSFYSIFHTPRERHQELLTRFASFLLPGGVLLITMGSSEWEGTEDDFFGAPMTWSHYGPERNAELVRTAGFDILDDAIDESGGERHQVIFARRV